MKKTMKPFTSAQIWEGKWYRMASPETSECCDCGLVHHTEYMLEDGRIFFRTKVDKRATRAARKAHGITITKEAPKV